MKRTVFTLLMVLAIALTSVSPAFAKTWNLNVHNNTEDDVKITLTGTKNYSFTVEPGKIGKEVEEGTYKYVYTACGEKVSGEVKVTDDMQWILIDLCGAPEEYAKFVVDSHLGDPITLELIGPQSYSLSIELGSNKFIQLQTGVYAYSYTACGGTIAGEVRVTKNGQGKLTLFACEQMANRFDSSVVSPSNLRIASHYAFPIRVTLLGPANYSIELSLGLNRLNVVKGTYTYSYTAYGQFRSGTITVTEIGTTVIFSPNK